MLSLCFLAHQGVKTGIVQELAVAAIWNEVPVFEVSDMRGKLVAHAVSLVASLGPDPDLCAVPLTSG